MYQGKNVSARLGAIYALLGVALLAALAMGVLGLVLPKPPVTKTDVAKAVNAVAGEQNLYAICEANITSSVTQAGGTLGGYKHVSIKTSKNGAKVTVKLTSDVYVGNLTCDMAKSNWSVAQVGP
jgi:hypothetical protein